MTTVERGTLISNGRPAFQSKAVNRVADRIFAVIPRSIWGD
jgi:hypothetical protein